MATNFNLSELTSRVVRSTIGIRRVSLSLDQQQQQQQGGKGILAWVVNAGKRLKGFLSSAVVALAKIGLSVTKVFGWFVNAKNFIWNFNWQATDQDLDASINSSLESIASSFGGFLGNTFGYAVCGFLPAAAMMVFNEGLGAYLMKEIAQEFKEEFTQNLNNLINQVFNVGVRVSLTSLYKNARKFIKANSRTVSKLLGGHKLKAIIDSWGSPGQQPWSFALNHEAKLDSISNTAKRNIAEEFAEEFDEACIEAGYIIANGIDSYLAQDALRNKVNPVLGKERYVELTPNRESQFTMILGGQEALIKQEIITQLNVNEQIGERDLGIIYGTDNNQPVRSVKPEVVLRFYQAKEDRIIGKNEQGKPIADPNPLTMRISFRLMDKSEDDFKADPKNFTNAYINELARNIYQEFAKPVFKISKGSELYTYHDWAKGYSLNLWVTSQSEARRVVRQVLDVQRHEYDSDKLRVGSKPVNGRKTRNKKTVLGKVVDVPVVGGKSGKVSFQGAYLNIGNGTDPINLVDLSGRRKNVIYKPKSS